MPLLRPLTTSQQDLLRTLGLALGYLPALLIPAKLDAPIVQRLTALVLRFRPGRLERLTARMEDTLGPRSTGRNLSNEGLARYQTALEGAWARVRNLHPYGWKATTTLEGLERIQEGQVAGSGTVLWRMSTGSSLIAKKALWEAGLPLVHLSTATHGARSESWIARKALAPLYRRTEKWYLAERVIIPESKATGAVMKTLLNRLGKENAVVSIVGDIRGTQNIQTRFFDAEAEFAIGSPSLAWKSGAVLLPVYSVREATGRYRVIVDAPISADRSQDRKTFVREAVEEYSRRLQEVIARFPGSWGGWPKLWSRTGIFQESAAKPSLPEEA